MSKLGKDLIQGLKEALAHASGEDTGALVHVFEVPDVKAIREDLHLTQSEFSEAYKIPLTTLQGWEQGRRHPDPAAATLLRVIERNPEVVEAVVADR